MNGRRIPIDARGQCVPPVHPRHGPPPVGGDGLVVGDAHLSTPRWQVCDAGRVSDVEDRAVSFCGTRTMRARFAVAHVDGDSRVSEQDGRRAVPPDASSPRLGCHLSRAPQRALRRMRPHDADRRRSCRVAGLNGCHQREAPSQGRCPPRPHGCSQRTGSICRCGERRQDERQSRSVPAETTPVRPPRHGYRRAEQRRDETPCKRQEQRRSGRHGAQAPGHQREHEDRRGQGKHPQEGEPLERPAAWSIAARPRQATRPWTDLESVLTQANRGARSQRSSVVCGQRHAQAGHASDRRRADRAQDSLSVCRRKDRVLACDARAGQRNVPRASNHSGSEGQSDVRTLDAGQVQVRAQGSAR